MRSAYSFTSGGSPGRWTMVPLALGVIGRSPHVVDVNDRNTALVCDVLETSDAVHHAQVVRRHVAETLAHIQDDHRRLHASSPVIRGLCCAVYSPGAMH